MTRKKILLFGAQGMLGTEIFNSSLERNDIEIIPLSRFNVNFENPENLEEIFEKFSQEFSFDVVVNTAAFTAVDKCEDEKIMNTAYSINALAPKLLAKKCAEKKIPFLHFSSDYVFSGNTDQKFSETDQKNPCNVYGEQKSAGEDFVLQYPTSKVIRTAWLIGDNGVNFVHKIVHLSKNVENINIVKNEQGSPSFCADVANAVFELILNLEKYPEKIYHFVNEGSASRREVGEEIQKFLETPTILTDVKSDFFELPAKRPISSILKNTLFPALPHWKDGLKKFLANEKERLDKKREIERKKERAKELYRKKQAEEKALKEEELKEKK